MPRCLVTFGGSSISQALMVPRTSARWASQHGQCQYMCSAVSSPLPHRGRNGESRSDRRALC
eukprot:14241635-Alexandrium_andersonii.AAC.1